MSLTTTGIQGSEEPKVITQNNAEKKLPLWKDAAQRVANLVKGLALGVAGSALSLFGLGVFIGETVLTLGGILCYPKDSFGCSLIKHGSSLFHKAIESIALATGKVTIE